MMEFANGKDDIPYMKWKIIQMFETTNQTCFEAHRAPRLYRIRMVYPLVNIQKTIENGHL